MRHVKFCLCNMFLESGTLPADVVKVGSIVAFEREPDNYIVTKKLQSYGEGVCEWNH